MTTGFTPDDKDDRRLEIVIAKRIRKLSMSRTRKVCYLVVKMVFYLDVCEGVYTKVHLKVAALPLGQKKQRQNNLSLRSVVVPYLDEPHVRELMKDLGEQDNIHRFPLGQCSQEHYVSK